jgi:hypothetical protein
MTRDFIVSCNELVREQSFGLQSGRILVDSRAV